MVYDHRQLLKDFFAGTIGPDDFREGYQARRVMWAEIRPDGLYNVSLAAGGKNTPLGIHPREKLEALAAQHAAGKLFIEGEAEA